MHTHTPQMRLEPLPLSRALLVVFYMASPVEDSELMGSLSVIALDRPLWWSPHCLRRARLSNLNLTQMHHHNGVGNPTNETSVIWWAYFEHQGYHQLLKPGISLLQNHDLLCTVELLKRVLTKFQNFFQSRLTGLCIALSWENKGLLVGCPALAGTLLFHHVQYFCHFRFCESKLA